MLITDITEAMLPLHLIETLSSKGGEWTVFTEEPFKTIEQAEAHRLLMLKEYPDLKPENVRVGIYDKERWRNDLTSAVLRNNDAVNRALSLLSNNTLVQLLGGEIEKSTNQIVYHWAEG